MYARVVLNPNCASSAIRRAQVRAESPLSPRSRIYIPRDGESGDRKTNLKKKEKPVRKLRTGFNLKWRFTMRGLRTERNALTGHQIIHSFFDLCVIGVPRRELESVGGSRASARRPLDPNRASPAIRRAQASAESPFSTRSCINILREVENGDRKTNSNKKGENRLRNRRRFSTLDCIWLCGESAQIEKIQRIIDPIRFPICAASARRLTSRSLRTSSDARSVPSRWLPPWRRGPSLFRGRTARDARSALRSR